MVVGGGQTPGSTIGNGRAAARSAMRGSTLADGGDVAVFSEHCGR